MNRFRFTITVALMAAASTPPVSGGELLLVGSVPFPDPSWGFGYVRDLTWDGAALWVAENGRSVVHRFDPATQVVTDSIGAPQSNPWGLAWANGQLFLTTTELIGTPPYVGLGKLWVYDLVSSWLYKGPAPGNPDSHPHGAAFDEALNVVWLSEAVAARIFAVAPATAEVVRSIQAPSVDTRGLTVAYNSLWAIDRANLALVRMSRSGDVLERFPLSIGPEPEGLAFDGVSFWVSENASDRLYQFHYRSISVLEVPALGSGELAVLAAALCAVGLRRIKRISTRGVA